MFCEKCGANLPDDSKFCGNCGARVSASTETPLKSQPIVNGDNAIAKPKSTSRKSILIIIISAVLLCVLGIAAALLLLNGNSRTKADNILVAAEKYLIEMNYEQAIIEFNKAIEIDPNNAYAYIGKAEALTALGKKDEALKVLNDGYKITKDERISDKISDYSNSHSSSSTSSSSSASESSTDLPSDTESSSSSEQGDSNPEERISLDYIDFSDLFGTNENISLSGNVITVYGEDWYDVKAWYYLDSNMKCAKIDTSKYGKLYFAGNYGCTDLGANFSSSHSYVVKATSSGLKLIKQSDYPMQVSENGYIAYYAETGNNHIVINVESPNGTIVSSTKLTEPYSTVYIGYGAYVSRLKTGYPHNCFIYERNGGELTGTDGFYIFGEDGTVLTPEALDSLSTSGDGIGLYYLGYGGDFYISEVQKAYKNNFPKSVTQNGIGYHYYDYRWSGEYYGMKAVVPYYVDGAAFDDYMGNIMNSDDLRYTIGDIPTGKIGKMYRDVSTSNGAIYTVTYENGKKGYVDENDKELASGFDNAGVFYGDYSFICENNKYYLINRNFEKIEEIQGTDVKSIGVGIFSCVRNNKLYLIKVV